MSDCALLSSKRLMLAADFVGLFEIEFQDRGRHPLKGIPGEWELLVVKG